MLRSQRELSAAIRPRTLAASVLGALLVTGLAGALVPAYAGGSFQHCIDQAANHNGEPPTCTKINGTWVASWPDESGGGGGFGFVVFLFFVGLVIAVGVTIWKVSTARSLARQSGMDPGLATQMTLLTDNGLDATYLASSLRRRQGSPAAPAAAQAAPQPASSAARLDELRDLLDRGLVTQAEYDERRKAIIDSV